MRAEEHLPQRIAQDAPVVEPRRHHHDVRLFRGLGTPHLAQPVALSGCDLARPVRKKNRLPPGKALAGYLVKNHLRNGKVKHGCPVEGVDRDPHPAPLPFIGPNPSYICLCATVGTRRQREDWKSCQKAAT
ncbi:hypothetical protein D9M72_578060 [compost metagenome]